MTSMEKRTDQEWSDDADSWYFDLRALGTQVESNRRNYRLLAVRNLTVAVVGLLAVLVLAYVTQRQEAQIGQIVRDGNRNVFAQCQVANRNATALNRTLDQIQRAVRISKLYTPEQRDQVLAVYESAKATLPVCGPEPR